MNSNDLKPIVLESWRHILAEHTSLMHDKENFWIFRGQENATWSLTTSLERAFTSSHIERDLPKCEQLLLFEFKRYYQLYASYVPPYGETITWLGLMQHFGAPTRLQDWTWSFYVALFFAIEKMSTDSSAKPCAVFALNRKWLDHKGANILGNKNPVLFDKYFSKATTFKNLFWSKKPASMVYRVNGLHLNERSTIQQGLFLCPVNILKSFEENLFEMRPPKGAIKKYIIMPDHELKKIILAGLYRMNMNRATLFPGLDGFAASLNHRLFLDEIFFPPKWTMSEELPL